LFSTRVTGHKEADASKNPCRLLQGVTFGFQHGTVVVTDRNVTPIALEEGQETWLGAFPLPPSSTVIIKNYNYFKFLA
jgi:hypothetical protein